MDTFLKYRIPGCPKVKYEGRFEPVIDVKEGFIVTNAAGDTVFRFINEPEEFDSKATKPKVSSKEEYLDTANKLILELHENKGKTVFSRVQEVDFHVELEDYYDRLCVEYPNAFVYMFADNVLGNWIGATPETLLRRDKSQMRSMALAGTKKGSDMSSWSSKEIEEHEFVANYIEDVVKKNNVSDFNRSDRNEVVSGPVRHLKTDFSWQNDPKEDWSIAQQMHPTPAVSGAPVSEALKMIQKYEKHDRELYTGMIGFVGEVTNLFVNLRCGQIIDSKIYLYLGGGFTKDSIAEEEWCETENKGKTLINLLKNG